MMSYQELESRTSPPELLIPADESQRLMALRRYHLLDTPPEPVFDRITRLAAAVLGMPISLVSLVDSLRNLQQRVHALGLIHSKLMHSENLERIGLEKFASTLCQSLIEIHGDQYADASLKIAAETTGLFIDIDLAIPLGLLINELISCAYKRDFPSHQRGIVAISLNVQWDGKTHLVIADNGTQTTDTHFHCTPIGEQIIAQLIGHMEADMTTQRHEGTRTTVTFPYRPSTWTVLVRKYDSLGPDGNGVGVAIHAYQEWGIRSLFISVSITEELTRRTRAIELLGHL
jgi:two-component sensor histidine kinase